MFEAPFTSPVSVPGWTTTEQVRNNESSVNYVVRIRTVEVRLLHSPSDAEWVSPSERSPHTTWRRWFLWRPVILLHSQMVPVQDTRPHFHRRTRDGPQRNLNLTNKTTVFFGKVVNDLGDCCWHEQHTKFLARVDQWALLCTHWGSRYSTEGRIGARHTDWFLSQGSHVP